jgi:hypothetical protein
VRIAIVGGVERNEPAYREVAERSGHTLSFHPGHMSSRGSASLAELSRRVDLLIVLTDVNSHGAVQVARRSARKHGIPLALYRRCSPTRFAAIVAGLDSFAAPRAASLGGG